MKVLVTGGAGFIGSHLVERLLAEGYSVVVIDDFSTGRKENLLGIQGFEKLEVFEVDITDRNALEEVFPIVDWVFHLAGKADIVPSIESPCMYYETNVTGTLNILQCSVSNGVKRFIYAASSSCYGIPQHYPTPETADISPRYPYALTKYLGEELVKHWGEVYKLPVISLRLFNVYGLRSRTTGAYGAVFGVFLGQKLKGKPFTVVGDGEQSRDFTYVTDVADAFYQAAKSSQSNLILNVGSGSHYTINKLVGLLGGDVINIPKRPGEPDCTFADVALIQKELGWQATVSFEDGVKNMLDNIDHWSDAPVWDEEAINAVTKTWFKYLS